MLHQSICPWRIFSCKCPISDKYQTFHANRRTDLSGTCHWPLWRNISQLSHLVFRTLQTEKILLNHSFLHFCRECFKKDCSEMDMCEELSASSRAGSCKKNCSHRKCSHTIKSCGNPTTTSKSEGSPGIENQTVCNKSQNRVFNMMSCTVQQNAKCFRQWSSWRTHLSTSNWKTFLTE